MLPVVVPAGQGPYSVSRLARVSADHPAVNGVPKDMGLVREAYPLEVKPGAQALMMVEGDSPLHWDVYSGGGRGDGVVVVGEGHDSPHAATLVTKKFYIDPATGLPGQTSIGGQNNPGDPVRVSYGIFPMAELFMTVSESPIPEPATMSLLVIGGLAILIRRKK